MSKFFLVNPKVGKSSDQSLISINEEKKNHFSSVEEKKQAANQKFLLKEETIKCRPGRIIVKVNVQEKNYWQFEEGQKIRLERQFNNFNRRETEPVNATVISSEYIPSGSEILIWHNALHDSNKVFDYPDQLSTHENESDIQYFSLPERECFAWRDGNGEMQPLKNYDFGLRVFDPYLGAIKGIPHKQLENVLYVTTGQYQGNAVLTLKACDYEIIFADRETGRESRLIRFRPHGIEEENREPEAIAILNEITKKIQSGDLYIGLNPSDCKPLQINAYAD